jgi:hypothetical protein
MQTIATIGLDIAKSVFQVHGIDAEGTVVGSPPSVQAALRAPNARRCAIEMISFDHCIENDKR